MSKSLPARLAAEFCRVLAEHIGADNVTLAAERNKTPEYAGSCCASHDFCDANMTMHEAMENLGLLTPVDAQDGTADHESACALWNSAWNIAKAADLRMAPAT